MLKPNRPQAKQHSATQLHMACLLATDNDKWWAYLSITMLPESTAKRNMEYTYRYLIQLRKWKCY